MFVFPKIARGRGGNFSDSGILLEALSNLKWEMELVFIYGMIIGILVVLDLLAKFGYRVIYDSHSNLDARVASVLRNGNWIWKPTRSDELVTIQSISLHPLVGDRWVLNEFSLKRKNKKNFS
jgi:hypothetical protein